MNDTGADKIVQEAFQYSPTTAFSFIVALLVMAVSVLTYATIYLYKQAIKQGLRVSEANDRDRGDMLSILMENKEANNAMTRSLENNCRMMTESFERDKEIIGNQRNIVDILKEIKR